MFFLPKALKKKKPKKMPRSLDCDESGSTRLTKLEIRTDIHGDTVVQGLTSVTVENFEDFIAIWTDALAVRAQRLYEQGVDIDEHENASHIISTVQVVSSNISTGHGSLGKLQFVDLASSDLVPRQQSTTAKSTDDSVLANVPFNSDWRLANRSLETLHEVVEARAQFSRSVPYRNSTVTHLLRDFLEADAKVFLFACVSSDPEDQRETISTLRFASRMRQVHVGKATKHTISPP
jgi:kinesin family protein C2/C3